MIENEEKESLLKDRIKDEKVLEFLNVLRKSINDKFEIRYAVTNEFKYKLRDGLPCSLYIRPLSKRIDIYLVKFSPDDVKIKSKSRNLGLTVEPNTSNEKDQFKSVIKVDDEWLTNPQNKANDLLVFTNELIDDIASDYA